MQHNSQHLTDSPLRKKFRRSTSDGGITGVCKSALLSAEGKIEVTHSYNKNNNLPQTNKENIKLSSYADVKPREEPPPTVKYLPKHSNKLSRLNGWKINCINSQVESIVEDEYLSIEQLSIQSKQLETYKTDENNADIERVLDLMKGNIQRNQMVADGVTDAMNKMMKIFDDKAKITGIIDRGT